MAYSTGEAPIKLSSEEKVTVNQVVNEATQIWKKAKNANLRIDNQPLCHQFMEKHRPLHRKFCEAYPIVFRYICQMCQYNAKVFRTWLQGVEKKPWTTEMEGMEAQANYASMLFAFYKPKSTTTERDVYRRKILQLLIDERDAFKKDLQKIHDEVIKREEELSKKNVTELAEFITAIGADGMATAGTFRVETKLPGGRAASDLDNIVPTQIDGDQLSAADLLL